MGFFSFITSDTKESIPNIHSNRESFTVYMKDNKGNVWEEKYYDGYGKFDDKDIYELIDEMNGGTGDRLKGIDIFFDKKNTTAIFPSLSRDPDYKWTGKRIDDCDYQGYFYEDDEDDGCICYEEDEEW